MPTDPKTFTQEEVNAIVAKARKTDEGKIAELQAELGNFQTVKAEGARRVTELEQQIASLTTERDTARNDLTSAKATHAAELGAAQRKLDDMTAAQRADSLSAQLAKALGATGALFPQAASIASREFERLCVPELGDDGALKGVTYNGKRYEDAKAAGQAFLDDHAYFALGAAGGAGTRPPRSLGGGEKKPLEQMSVGELAEAARQERLKKEGRA